MQKKDLATKEQKQRRQHAVDHDKRRKELKMGGEERESEVVKLI